MRAKKIVSILIGSFVLIFLSLSQKTFSQSECKPLDLVLVIDTSSTMKDPGSDDIPKLTAVKEVLIGPQSGCTDSSSCVNGDNCCPPSCNSSNDSDCTGYIDQQLRSEDRVAVVHFATNAYTDTHLTDPKTLSKQKIKELLYGGSAALGSGINQAWYEIQKNGAETSIKAMIIITDGEPNSREEVINQATKAKYRNIRIIIIGYGITDPSLDNFFKTVTTKPEDYFKVSTKAELQSVLNSLSASFLLCDTNPPQLSSASRDSYQPYTVFPNNKVLLSVTFTDNQPSDWGLATTTLSWTEDNWATQVNLDPPCSIPLKKEYTCPPEVPFEIPASAVNEGDVFQWKAKAIDGAGHTTTAGPYSFQVASVSINVNPDKSYAGKLVKGTTNKIEFVINDLEGKANLVANYYLKIYSPSDASSPLIKDVLTNCTGDGYTYTCTYSFDISSDESWGTDAKISFYPYDLLHNPAKEKIVDVYEDVEPPSIAVSHSPDPVLDKDTVTLTITATDESGIYSMKICWRENGGDWTCHEWENPVSSTQSIQIGPFSQETIIEYYGEAVDTAYNTGKTDTQSFTVFSSQCYDDERNYLGDLTHCNGDSGRCCGGICDTSYSCSLDDECSKETCSGTSWTCTPANAGENCCQGTNCDGCYPRTSCDDYGGGAGCEIRDYSCNSSGKCVYSVSTYNCDFCSGKRLHNYECSGSNCKQIETINCSKSDNWDGDAIKCNCDCDCYDIEEKVGVSCGGKDVCKDFKDNDCDGLIDCQEPSCDTLAPLVIVSAYDSKGGFIPDGGKVKEENTNKVKLSVFSLELDPCGWGVNSVYEVKVFYKLNNGSWSLIIDCKDKDGNGKCDDDPSLNISFFSVEIPEDGIPAGTTVYYKAEATDSVYNTAVDEGWFIVVSGECLGKPDLSSCAGGAGVCCGEVCNTKKECDLDDECSVDACDEIYWTCTPANEGNSCSSGTWTKKREITIDNSSSSETLRNFPIKVDVPYDSDMQLDFDDIRFTDENGAPLAFYKEGVGQVLRVKYKGKYKCPSTHEELIDDYDFNTIYEKTLDDRIDSPRNVGTHFNWLYTTWLYVKKPGYWAFAIDGDEAVEVEVDGEIVASWYGGHGFCDCYDHNGSIYLNKDWHKVIIRHEENYYDDGVILYFKSPIDNQWKVFSKDNLKGRGIIFAYLPEDSELQSKTFIQNGLSGTKSAAFWVRVPFIPATSTKTIYMYYGNPEATDASQLKETFEFSDDFEEGSLNGWSFSGDKGWEISTTHYEGSYGIQNEDIKDNQEACIFKNVTLPNGGKISFYWKVSSEKYYDFLKFYINGEEKAKISGEVSWHQRVFDLPSGNSEIKFCYTKDANTSKGADTGYVDLIIIKPKPPLLSISISSNEETVNAIETGGCFSLPGYTETRGPLASAYLNGCEKVDEGKCYQGKCMFKILDEKKDRCEDPSTSYNLLDYKCSGEDCSLTSSNPSLLCDYTPPYVDLSAYKPPYEGDDLIPSCYEVTNLDECTITKQDTSTDKGIKIISNVLEDVPSPLSSYVYSHQISYRVKPLGGVFGEWKTLCECTFSGTGLNCFSCNPGTDSHCISPCNPSDISHIEVYFGNFERGDEVEYRVIAVDSQLNSKEVIKKFIIKNNPPSVSVGPGDEGRIVYPNSSDCFSNTIYVTFKWKFSDPDPGDSQKAVHIQIGKDKDGDGFSWTDSDDIVWDQIVFQDSETLSTQFYGVSLDWNTLYFWRIKVQDTPGSWSPWQEKDTEGNILKFKTPLHPYPDVDFSWSPATLGEAPQTVNFTDNSTCYCLKPNGDILSFPCSQDSSTYPPACSPKVSKIEYYWDFNYIEGENVEANPDNTQENPSYTYYTEGHYDVYLLIKQTDATSTFSVFKCYSLKTLSIGAKEFPLWKEVKPE